MKLSHLKIGYYPERREGGQHVGMPSMGVTVEHWNGNLIRVMDGRSMGQNLIKAIMLMELCVGEKMEEDYEHMSVTDIKAASHN